MAIQGVLAIYGATLERDMRRDRQTGGRMDGTGFHTKIIIFPTIQKMSTYKFRYIQYNTISYIPVSFLDSTGHLTAVYLMELSK